MQTIIVLLDPGKLKNPDLDLCYCVPDRIEQVSGLAIQSNGYDFLDASASARIYISENDADDMENCSLVFPE